MLTQNRVEIKYLLITLALLAGLVTLNQTQAFRELNNEMNVLFDGLTRLGFVGFFVLAALANASLIIHLPYNMPLLSVAMSGAGLPYLLLMGFAAGLGAGVGEIVSYSVAFKILGSNPHLEKSPLFQWVKRMAYTHPYLVPLIMFAFSLSPIPDDPVIIPLAIVRYGLKRIVLPMFLGKILHNMAVAAIFYYFTDWAAARVSASVQTDLAFGVLVLFVMVILYQVEKNATAQSVDTGLRQVSTD